MDSKEKLQKALSAIKKQYGNTSAMLLGEAPVFNGRVISTGSINLDIALGIGGFPKGRIIEIYGPESSGKTTLALSTGGQAQKAGYTVAIIDTEHALDPSYAEQLGLDLDEVILSQPDNGEQALKIAQTLIEQGIDVVIVDSVAALVPEAEIKGEIGDNHVGLQARLMSQAMRILSPLVSKHEATLIFTNQIREKVGVMFGNPETTTGGRALKFFSTIRLEVRAGEKMVEDGIPIGHTMNVKVVKNKVAPPFKKCEIPLVYGKGFDFYSELIDGCINCGIIKKSGSWLSYKDVKTAGKANFKNKLYENPSLGDELYSELKSLVCQTTIEDIDSDEQKFDEETGELIE